MDKRRSCANCGSADHQLADCTSYKQVMKSLGYTPDEDDMNQMEENEFYSGLIINVGAKRFFCNQKSHFSLDCPLFWEAVKNQNHPKHKLAEVMLDKDGITIYTKTMITSDENLVGQFYVGREESK